IHRGRHSLIGRDRDIERVHEALLSRPEVTVVGPVGCGKTALAWAVAARLTASFPDGVFFVDLSDVTAPALVNERVRESLGLQPDGALAVDQVVAYAADRCLLFVLDNCEQVVGPVMALADRILDAAPEVRILATSRQPLSLHGEQLHALHPVDLPTDDSPAAMAGSTAVTLFLERLGND